MTIGVQIGNAGDRTVATIAPRISSTWERECELTRQLER